jgi:hypothetical protein
MTSLAQSVPQGISDLVDRITHWPKPAIIAAMVAGFVLFWPIGLAFVYILVRRHKMSCRNTNLYRSEWSTLGAMRPTGNAAFDDYRRATLERLQEESREFGAFVERLRRAKDESEFEAFMADRAAKNGPAV